MFVEELDEVPDDRPPVVFSAHGVPKSVPAEAAARELYLARRHLPAGLQGAPRGRAPSRRAAATSLLIGHAGHPEVVGTMGQLPEGAVTLVETVADARRRSCPPTRRSARLHHPDHAVGRRHRRDRRRPARAASRPSTAPRKRGHLLRHHQPPGGGEGDRAARATLVVVVGAPNSSNSVRLVEVAERAGAPRAVLVQRARRHRLGRLAGRAPRSASPPAPRRPRCWSRRWSTACRDALRRHGRGSAPWRRRT